MRILRLLKLRQSAKVKTLAAIRPHLYLPEQVLKQTALLVADFGTKAVPHEGIAYWAGVAQMGAWVVTTVIVPDAITTPGSFNTSALANAWVVAQINEYRLNLLAQIHTHPTSRVDHSKGDNEGAFMPYDGFYSIVVPWYGSRGLMPLTKCGIHQYEVDHFRQLSRDEIQRFFHVIPGNIDLRGDKQSQ